MAWKGIKQFFRKDIEVRCEYCIHSSDFDGACVCQLENIELRKETAANLRMTRSNVPLRIFPLCVNMIRRISSYNPNTRLPWMSYCRGRRVFHK